MLTSTAPFPSAAGPGILPFFEGCGPYKRWVPPAEKLTLNGMKQGEASGTMHPQVEDLIRTTVQSVQSRGGHVVGVIGFSQGTRVVAGLLKGSEIMKKLKEEGSGGEGERGDLKWLDFAFALSVCGSYPPPLIPPSASAALASSSLSADQQKALVQSKINIPTYHVQGVSDEWAWAGKLLIEHSYEVGEDKSVVMEADMGHHYPAKPEESEKLKDWVLDMYQKSVKGAEKR
jgi:hypothetical protein